MARSLGAFVLETPDPHQPQADGVVVVLDPDGHPVCVVPEGC